MNKVILIGRLVADPDVRYTQGSQPMAIARYRLAVDRKVKKEGEQTADFISCVAFGKNGEFVDKNLRKATKIAIVGRIQTGSYKNQNGQTVYTTDIVVEDHDFCESKSTGGNTSNNSDNGYSNPTFPGSAAICDGFMSIPDNYGEEGLPF